MCGSPAARDGATPCCSATGCEPTHEHAPSTSRSSGTAPPGAAAPPSTPRPRNRGSTGPGHSCAGGPSAPGGSRRGPEPTASAPWLLVQRRVQRDRCGLQCPRDRASLLGRLGDPLEIRVLDAGDRGDGTQVDTGDAGPGHERHFGAGAHRGGGGPVLVELVGQRHGEACRMCGCQQFLGIGRPGGGLGAGLPVDVEGGQTGGAQFGLTGAGTEVPVPGTGGGGGHGRRHTILRMVVGSVSSSILHAGRAARTTAGTHLPSSSPYSPPTYPIPAVVPHRRRTPPPPTPNATYAT